MGGFTLKIKTKQGQHIVDDLSAEVTIGALKSKIAEITRIPVQCLNVLIGFPPKPLDLSANENSLSTTGIINGDTLIIEEKILPDVVAAATTKVVGVDRCLLAKRSEVEGSDSDIHVNSEGILLKQVVPSDNSCLFTSIGFVMNGKMDTEVSAYLREVIAEHVSTDKDSFNEAILGKPNLEYCEWIRRPESWGGAIEVSILSNYYGVEIAVVDITNALINRFGEDKDFGMRVFLLFDGIHYDPLYLESLSGGPIKTMFPVEDESILQQAEQLAHEAKSSRQFTDVNKFTLKCIQCDQFLTGQVEAQKHAQSTGHNNFGEV